MLAGAALVVTGSVAAFAAGEGRVGSPADRCSASDLSARLVDTGGSGAGTLEVGLLLTNTWHTRWVLDGFLGLGLLDGSELPMPGYAAFDSARQASIVLLTPGGTSGACIRVQRRAYQYRNAMLAKLVPAVDASERPCPSRAARSPGAERRRADAGDADGGARIRGVAAW